jgi:hypothetical protein
MKRDKIDIKMSYLIPALMSILMLAGSGCSHEEELNEGNVCVLTFTQAGLRISTKATTSSPLPKNSTVDIAAYKIVSSVEASANTQEKSYIISNDVGALTPTSGRVALLGPQDYQFYFFSPASDWNSGNDKTLSIANGTDFSVSSCTVSVSGDVQTVTVPDLSRKCSNVDFLMECAPGNTVTSAVIGPLGVSIGGMTHSPMVYTLSSSCPAIDVSGQAQDATCTLPQSSFTVTGNNSEASLPVLPKSIGNITLTTNILLNGSTTSIPLSFPVSGIAFVAGYRYVFVVKVSDTGIEAVLHVLPWNYQDDSTNAGIPGYTIILGSWTLKSIAASEGSGSAILTIGGWVPSSSAASEGNGSGILNGTWLPVSGTTTGGSGSGTINNGSWTNGSSTNTLGGN